MPVMDGFETAKHISQKWPKIKIVLFSMHNDSTYIDKGLKMGAHAFIAKDAPSSEFIKALYEITKNKETV